MHEIAELFGVGEAQVRRDHVISHALAALSTLGTDDLVFFGGTALSRTHLPALRLSEDIDLIALGPRAATASAVGKTLSRLLRRSLGRPRFAPPLEETRDADPSTMTIGSVRVQIQLLSASHLPHGRPRSSTSNSGTAMPRPPRCAFSHRHPSPPPNLPPGMTEPRRAISMTSGLWPPPG
ncbi:nucleotidyl transferase AbiEii/AbiGii toxin family protein [Brachybacterium paraconglomeratum]